MARFVRQLSACFFIFTLIDSVCARDEVVNGDIVTDPAELPFVCRIEIRGRGRSQFCGGSLISEDFLATAKHCVDDFYDICVRIRDCYVSCRDLNREEHEIGQFRVSIIDVFLKPGRSDLALVKLKDPVHKHPDYSLGPPIAPVILASQEPKPGEMVLTAGWGRTGYKQGPSKQLRRLQLKVTSVEDLWVFTGVTNSRGQLVDTCEGDSGGPLLLQREGQWQLIGTLKGGGFDCEDNSTSGDGEWNNVVSQRQWIRQQMLPEGPTGEIELVGGLTELGGAVVEGNVYIDGNPVQFQSCPSKMSELGHQSRENSSSGSFRMLDYSIGIPRVGSKYGRVENGQRFGLNDVACEGDEQSLLDCPHTQRQNCGPSEAAGVTCFHDDETPIGSVATSPPVSASTALATSKDGSVYDLLKGKAVRGDTAVFSGYRNDYRISDNGDGTYSVASREGTDTFSNVQNLQFDDGYVTLSSRATMDDIHELGRAIGLAIVNGDGTWMGHKV